MKLFKILAIAALAMVSSASAQAGVTLSNLDASGGVTTTSTAQTSLVRTAAGFRTNSTVASTVESFSAWLEAPTSTAINTGFSIYDAVYDSGVDGYRPGSTVIASSATQNVDTKGSYTFSFSPSVQLTANTRYFIVATDGTSNGVSWFTMQNSSSGAVLPSARNSSGYAFIGYRQTGDFNVASPDWLSAAPQANGYSFELTGTPSVDPVPEPALTSLLCLGGVALIRRRMKK
jgi:hypothetical protein